MIFQCTDAAIVSILTLLPNANSLQHLRTNEQIYKKAKIDN
jgi:hypothetical protein